MPHGFSDGTGRSRGTYELPGSGVNGAFLNGVLVGGSVDSGGVAGRYRYGIRNGIDLDVDSDNNNGFELPFGSSSEAEEAAEIHPSRPGKIIGVNDNDDDGDGVADYADGYNFDAAALADDTNGRERFVPVAVTLPTGVNPARSPS